MNKFFNKILKFADQLAGDYNNKLGKGGKAKGSKKDANVVDIKSRRKDRDTEQGLNDFSGGAGI